MVDAKATAEVAVSSLPTHCGCTPCMFADQASQDRNWKAPIVKQLIAEEQGSVSGMDYSLAGRDARAIAVAVEHFEEAEIEIRFSIS